jgi:saccharopine dehydrogenase-like NADP-dependent oxidoreductase
MKSLKMLDETVSDYSNMTYAGFLAERAGTNTEILKEYITGVMGWDESSVPFRSLDYLGFFSDEKLNYKSASPFEITSDRMISRMTLSTYEQDTVMMQHIFLASYPDGRKEVIKSSMLDFGSPSENTAVARTVALPASIAVKLILDKTIKLSGVHRPVLPGIYEPVLKELEQLGIEMKEEYGLPVTEIIQ